MYIDFSLSLKYIGYIVDCSKDCLRCYSEKDCSVCKSGTYLKNGGCVTECGQGFMPNMETRECQRKYYICLALCGFYAPEGHIKIAPSIYLSVRPSFFLCPCHNFVLHEWFFIQLGRSVWHIKTTCHKEEPYPYQKVTFLA